MGLSWKDSIDLQIWSGWKFFTLCEGGRQSHSGMRGRRERLRNEEMENDGREEKGHLKP